MPAVACRECKKEVARNAKLCPHCGALNPVVSAPEPLLELGVLALILAGSVAMCSDSMSGPVDATRGHVEKITTEERFMPRTSRNHVFCETESFTIRGVANDSHRFLKARRAGGERV